jgi:hypothetical protein
VGMFRVSVLAEMSNTRMTTLQCRRSFQLTVLAAAPIVAG